MTAGVLGAAWATLVLWAAAIRRPPPRQFASLPAVLSPGPDHDRSDPGDRTSARPAPLTLGAVLVVTTVVLVVAPALLPLLVLGALALPRMVARRDHLRRLRRLEADLPETVDLLALAVGAGCNVRLAVAAAGRRGTGPMAAELRRVTAEADGGRRLADAIDELPARAGESVRPLAAALAGSERYGAPLAASLDRIADQVRRQRQRRAEEAARKVPVMLLFPLVLCILPAFALLTVAPLIAGALRELRL